MYDCHIMEINHTPLGITPIEKSEETHKLFM